jgi:hypothetical protein
MSLHILRQPGRVQLGGARLGGQSLDNKAVSSSFSTHRQPKDPLVLHHLQPLQECCFSCLASGAGKQQGGAVGHSGGSAPAASPPAPHPACPVNAWPHRRCEVGNARIQHRDEGDPGMRAKVSTSSDDNDSLAWRSAKSTPGRYGLASATSAGVKQHAMCPLG